MTRRKSPSPAHLKTLGRLTDIRKVSDGTIMNVDPDLLPCPFCGKPTSYGARGYIACRDGDCPASTVYATMETWNARPLPKGMRSADEWVEEFSTMSELVGRVPSVKWHADFIRSIQKDAACAAIRNHGEGVIRWSLSF
jgi:hypothetical protein